MPIVVFENTTEKPLAFVVEPKPERYEVPVLAKVGVRYSFEAGVVDRTFVHVEEGKIRFWCDSQGREVELVYPTPFDLLLTDVCVRLGFCGGLVNDEPTHVAQLLPATGIVTAEQFARLAISAECDQRSAPDKEARWEAKLISAFIEHLGAASVPADSLVRNHALPFE